MQLALRNRRAFAFGRLHLGFTIVPQQTAIVIERLGKYKVTLEPGFHFLIPIVDNIKYKHSLKEEVYPISSQMAITNDNVTIHIDGVLYLKITDPYKASYGVGDPVEAMKQLAQTTMRSELGKLSLDKTFEERESLNHSIVNALNLASEYWGIQCMRYEIRDIQTPPNIQKAMELQAESERQKRADILQSEGSRQASINKAEGMRQAAILSAEGEAKAIIAKAKATAEGIDALSLAILEHGGKDAMKLRLMEQYINTFSELAKVNKAVIVPESNDDISKLLVKSLAVYNAIDNKSTKAADAPQVRKVVDKSRYSDPVLDSTEQNQVLELFQLEVH